MEYIKILKKTLKNKAKLTDCYEKGIFEKIREWFLNMDLEEVYLIKPYFFYVFFN